MFTHAFVRDAYLAGTSIGLACGAVGWFLVLRAEVFAADALSHVTFVGAVGAAVLGADERLGLFALTLAVAAGLGLLGRRGRADDALIGTVFAWVLGLGLLLLTLLASGPAAASGISAATTLFGSIFTIGTGAAWLAAAVALGVVVALGVIARPLLLASLDAEQARARGVPVGILGPGFLALLALVTAEGAQAVGALLVLALLAAPAGAAHCLTARPWMGLALSGALAAAAVWTGLAVSYLIASIPPSSAVVGVAALEFLAAAGLGRASGHAARRRLSGA